MYTLKLVRINIHCPSYRNLWTYIKGLRYISSVMSMEPITFSGLKMGMTLSYPSGHGMGYLNLQLCNLEIQMLPQISWNILIIQLGKPVMILCLLIWMLYSNIVIQRRNMRNMFSELCNVCRKLDFIYSLNNVSSIWKPWDIWVWVYQHKECQ